jgi:hypothetical protein
MNDHYKRRSHEREIRDHNGAASGPGGSKYDDPPNSRLFIVCGKSITEDDFKESFEPYGIIEEIWVLRDKVTNEPKGVTYIKFSKTSEAALAMEEMNGRCIGSHPRPLKVLIAHSRDQGSRREMNEEERLVRLFVVVPKSMSETDLKDYFNQFGDVDYVSIVRDRTTKESKGFAYIKYHRMSHAAKAFEACDRIYKPVFADPKPQKSGYHDGGGGSNSDRLLVSGGGGGPGSTASASTTASISAVGGYDMLTYMDTSHSNPEGHCRLTVVTSPLINQDQLWRLFDLVPGLDYCELKRVEGRGRDRSSKAIGTVVFNNPQSATYAKEKLHGFEYPPGHRLIVKFEEGSVSSGGGGGHGGGYSAGPPPLPSLPYGNLPLGRPQGGYMAPPPLTAGGPPGSYPLAPRLPPPPLAPPLQPHHHTSVAGRPHANSIPTDLQTLADTIAQATSIIQAAGYTTGGNHLGGGHLPGGATAANSVVPETYDPSYCSVKLPAPQPLAPPDSPVAERLFVVCTPYHPVIYILKVSTL